jgi:protein involved in polysaccharide export with SLBB domain
MPETVLLGSHLPNLIWLTDSQNADANETQSQIETLWDARCNLVGAVLNRETSKSVKRKFTRWLGGIAAFAALAGAGDLRAQFTNVPPPMTRLLIEPTDGSETNRMEPSTNLLFAVANPAQREPWQQRLTLGPGDVLSFALFGEPTLAHSEVTIAPDGRVSYLEARDVLAAGLTVDELRTKFDQELGQFRRAPHTIITPMSYRSKKYFVLGKVMQKGVYVLDRPITVVEAIARAHGFENGQVDNNTLDLADLPRSFLMRNGKRMPVDFEKLVQSGDLSQNIPIEPGDYLFFPSASIKQVYVLGEVGLPGMVTYRPDLTVVAAISSRGGFNEKSYKTRVMVVRGSINHPEAFAVDTMAITSGHAPDFKLQAKDIVYVSHRPWYRVEELLDLATTAFLQAVVSSWAGRDVVSPIK